MFLLSTKGYFPIGKRNANRVGVNNAKTYAQFSSKQRCVSIRYNGCCEEKDDLNNCRSNSNKPYYSVVSQKTQNYLLTPDDEVGKYQL